MAEFNIPPPSDRQKEFFTAREKFVFYGGAKGGGKSWSLRWKSILRRLNYPKSKGLLVRRTYPELYRNHILEIQKELPKTIYKYTDQKHIFTFANESTLELGSIQHEGDIFNYQGAEYDDIAMDEAGQFTEPMFQNLKTNLRTVRSDLKTQMYLGSNPGGVGHGWLKRLFIDKKYQNNENPDDYRFIPAKVYDNFILMEKMPEYVTELEALPSDLKRAYLEGDWDVFSGQVFSEWSRDAHTIDYYPEGFAYTSKVMSFDWGYNDMGAAVFLAKLPDGHLLQYREIYQNRKTPEEWADDILAVTRNTPVEYYLLPHDCFSRQQGRDSIAEVFKRKGLNPIKRADSLSRDSRMNGLALFHQYLSNAPDGIPYFQVSNICTETIRSLPYLVYDQRGDSLKSEDVNTDGEDHLYDAIRIALTDFGKPKGRGGGVRPQNLEKKRDFFSNIYKAPDLKKMIADTLTNRKSWKYR